MEDSSPRGAPDAVVLDGVTFAFAEQVELRDLHTSHLAPPRSLPSLMAPIANRQSPIANRQSRGA